MTLYLVRHAHAGSRHSWHQPDDERPLSAKGENQAAELAKALGSLRVERILSSPSRRCVDTMTPLGDALGIDVEPNRALDERADDTQVLRLVSDLEGNDAALCTHANIVPVILDHLRRNGTRFGPGPHDWKKGSVWVLETDDAGAFTEARYVPPPKA